MIERSVIQSVGLQLAPVADCQSMIPPDVIITTLVGTPYRIGVRPTNLTMHETVFTVTWQAVLPDLVLTYTESPVADSSMGVGVGFALVAAVARQRTSVLAGRRSTPCSS